MLIFCQVKDPHANPVNEKPAEVNVLGNTARGRLAAKPSANPNDQVTFPYGCYPPPLMSPAMYYSSMVAPQMPAGFFPPAPGFTVPPSGFLPPPGPPTVPPPVLSQPLNYPLISEWIEYCDRHPNRVGGNLSSVIPKFQDQGFRYINQLTGSRVTIEKLSDWLSVGPGTADLIISYAEEDCKLIATGTFRMELPRGLVAAAEEI